MSFWLREVVGWALVVLGLASFWTCYQFLLASAIFEAGPMLVIGIFIFRGGIHLLKIAVAARVCLDATTAVKAVKAKLAP